VVTVLHYPPVILSSGKLFALKTGKLEMRRHFRVGRKYRNLKFSVDEEGIALVTINRPEVLNALGIEVFIEIGSVFDELKENATRVVILTGEGEKAFASGADIVGMQNGRS
jgi:enoyl-CoA hydratase/carnithine racemase